MEEDREFVRLLIKQAREDIIKLFDDILKDFNHLKGSTFSKRKYHSKHGIRNYNHNLGVINCKVRRTMGFIFTMIRGFKMSLNYRENKAIKLNEIYERAKRKVNGSGCTKGGKNESIL